ncbi:exodeoxyribonuclease V alpha chain [Marinomonas sp. MED121]|uniref:exodeoxyribonuclease V subunit alpha n=1 Tax=Marinomonas sp. MED121 TaxID=314277 RepID=UPI000068FC01|nr:exodeoxyribonuclease V subunit alpha [Marinomonas sp. MED121]EAQ63778.1 exodeoxyribonuclease V alpha chain [Marinomonas sp. MED121]
MNSSNAAPLIVNDPLLMIEQEAKQSFFEKIAHWPSLGLIRQLDLHTCLRLAGHCHEQRSEVLLAALVTSFYLGQGHSCLPLKRLFDSPFANVTQSQWQSALHSLDVFSLDQLMCALKASPLVQLVESKPLIPKHVTTLSKPFVLDGERLYLARYYAFETQVIEYIQKAQSHASYAFDGAWLTQLFPSGETALNEFDWQKIAVANAALQSFSVISGGPGTGKTTTVTKLLVLLARQAQALSQGLTIELAAPTGKAAARLTQSIIQAKDKLRKSTDFNDAVFDLIPEQASTLHRLLGSEYGRSGFKHNAKNPLHLDVLLVDEASMVDLPMMAKLLAALPPNARLILLGDKDQLASVEAGSVLADLTYGIEPIQFSETWAKRLGQLTQTDFTDLIQHDENHAVSIRQSLSLLVKSYRFDQNSGIGHLASAVNLGDAAQSLSILNQSGDQYPDLAWQKLDQVEKGLDIAALAKGYDKYWLGVKGVLHDGASIQSLFQLFSNYQILCAVRSGDYGVESLNHQLQEHFYKRGRMLNPQGWYAGKAIIITRNDANLGLFNGDIGICLPDEQDKERMRVWFELPDGSFKAYLPSRLSENEAVFVMTVHKSQGSEFQHVELVLPPYESPVMTKELIYTGITRAKSHFSLWASVDVIKTGIQTRVARHSGLIDKLWCH